MSYWSSLITEQINPATAEIDELSTTQLLTTINAEDAKVPDAVALQIPAIADAVDRISLVLDAGGHVFYLGAGTSGRLGIVDAAECPPTFNTSPDLFKAIIAGGHQAVFTAVEAAEDRPEEAARDLLEAGLRPGDVVVGIAASGVTPYVLNGLHFARDTGCVSVFISCNPNMATEIDTDVKIAIATGPEVIAGSTRMKAGTATKLVLNMISTAAMIKLGKTFGNLMVDLQPTNAKLKDRSLRILSALTDIDHDGAAERLTEADGDLKTAIIMELCDLERDAASQQLAACGGNLKQAVARSRATL